MKLLLNSIVLALATISAQAWTSNRMDRRQALVTAGSGAAVTALGLPVPSAVAADNDDKKLYRPPPNSMTGRTVVITGGTTGLGLESAKRLAAAGATVVLTARTPAKGEQAVAQVQQYVQDQQGAAASVSYKVVNLDDLNQLQTVKDWSDVKQIDVLMNNAGVMAIPDRQLTVDGYERQIATNHLGHFVLTALLQPKLSPQARIINVSSMAYLIAGGQKQAIEQMNDEIYWKPSAETYQPWGQYGQSKLANIYFTQELQRRSDAAGKQWTVTALHPGAVTTDLGRYIVGEDKWRQLKEGESGPVAEWTARALSVFLKTVPEGASTQVYLAAADPSQVASPTARGQFWNDCHVEPLQQYALDPVAAERLWAESEARAGMKFQIE